MHYKELVRIANIVNGGVPVEAFPVEPYNVVDKHDEFYREILRTRNVEQVTVFARKWNPRVRFDAGLLKVAIEEHRGLVALLRKANLHTVDFRSSVSGHTIHSMIC